MKSLVIMDSEDMNKLLEYRGETNYIHLYIPCMSDEQSEEVTKLIGEIFKDEK